MINEISRFLQLMIVLGTSARIIFCFIKLQHEDEEKSVYKKRLKHGILFLVLSAAAFEVYNVISGYYL